VETIKKFKLLPRRFYEEDGDVTPTKKVKRRYLEKRYADMIEKMYKGLHRLMFKLEIRSTKLETNTNDQSTKS